VEASYGIPRPDARAQRARVRGMRFRLAWAIGAAIALSASTATANGRFPASNQFLFSPSNPNLIWLRTTYGILPSTDDGSSWAYLCEDVFGLQSAGGSGYEDPGVALMSNGNVIVSDSRGVSVSTDQGCTWSCQGGMLAKQAFIDLAVSPSDVTTAVVLTATYVASDSGTTNTYSQVFRTTDYGMTWNPVGPPLDPTVLVQTVDLAKSDPTRIYVSGTRNFGIAKTASLFMYTMYTTAGDAGADDASADGGFAEGSADGGSANAGGQWLEQPITEFDNAQEESIYIAAVDPNDADTVYLRTDSLEMGGESRLYVTQNASATTDGGVGAATFTIPMGASFQVPSPPDGNPFVVTGELVGFALSQDGSKVYVGTKESGLWAAQTSDLVFSQINSTYAIECLATRPGTDQLWACSNLLTPEGAAAPGGFIAGVSTDDGMTFTPKLCSVTGLTGVISCPATEGSTSLGCAATGDTAQVCGPASAPNTPLNTVCTLDSIDFMCTPNSCAEDGGPSDAGSGEHRTASSSCGCAAVGTSGGTVGAAAALVLVATTLGRRRRRDARAERQDANSLE
jgi:MYXO-CTERM domain-containing protein